MPVVLQLHEFPSTSQLHCTHTPTKIPRPGGSESGADLLVSLCLVRVALHVDDAFACRQMRE